MSAEVIDIDPYSDRAEWLQRRQKGIGASDAAAALGLSPWVTPYALWAEKALGVVDDEQSEPMYWGSALEPVILDRYKSQHRGTPIARATGFFMSVERPHLLATPDGLVGTEGLVEVKTASGWTASDWDDDVPIQYQVQCQHQLYVTGKRWCDLAVLIGGSDYREYRIDRDDEAINNIVAQLDWFWDLVISKTPPPVTAGRSTDRTFTLIVNDEAPAATLPDDTVALIEQIQTAKGWIKHWTAQKDQAEAEIKGRLGEATEGFIPDLDKPVRFPQRSRSTVDLKAVQKADPELAKKLEPYINESRFRVLYLPKI